MRFKNDRYRRARGGNTKLLRIVCLKCGEEVCAYQKDGIGNLFRLYLDRMSDVKVDAFGESLKCNNGHLIGVKMVYTKEHRPAFRLVPGGIKKSIV